MRKCSITGVAASTRSKPRGVVRVNRTTRQLSLTEEGERYFRRMQVVLQEMAAAENDRRHLLQYHLHPPKIALAFLCQTELAGGPIKQADTLLETRTTPRGLLRVDAATPVMLHFLMPLVKPFRESFPGNARETASPAA
jgi:DNA-binding transcriptional LysR family regulator